MIVAPADSLLLDCRVDQPPDETSKPTLVKAWNSQTANLSNCNHRLEGLREWKKEVTKENQ